jgi:hypothetical protein
MKKDILDPCDYCNYLHDCENCKVEIMKNSIKLLVDSLTYIHDECDWSNGDVKIGHKASHTIHHFKNMMEGNN